jgi:hypothetical protein
MRDLPGNDGTLREICGAKNRAFFILRKLAGEHIKSCVLCKQSKKIFTVD